MPKPIKPSPKPRKPKEEMSHREMLERILEILEEFTPTDRELATLGKLLRRSEDITDKLERVARAMKALDEAN